MNFTTKISAIYRVHGPKHLLPFIGRSYQDGSPEAFRVAVIGLNAYVSDGDWPEDDSELQGWYRGWWSEAGHGQSHRFFNTAYREAGLLAAKLAGRSKLFGGLQYDADPQRKAGFYGTNAVKIFLGEQHKTSNGLTDTDFQKFAPTWRRELDVMAEHRVLPHLIVALGRQIWDLMWSSFYPEGPGRVQYQHFTITDYETCGNENGSCYHHANLITAQVGTEKQKLLLVRLAHPANYGDRRRAEWLLQDHDFRALAELT